MICHARADEFSAWNLFAKKVSTNLVRHTSSGCMRQARKMRYSLGLLVLGFLSLISTPLVKDRSTACKLFARTFFFAIRRLSIIAFSFTLN